MRSYITFLSILGLLFGAIGILYGFVLFCSSASTGEGTGIVVGPGYLAAGVLWLAAGWCLMGRRGWARIMMVVLVFFTGLGGLVTSWQALDMSGMYRDAGTIMLVTGALCLAFSIYALCVLLSSRTAALFVPNNDPLAAGTLLR